MNAGIPCQGFMWMIAKRAAEMTIAQTGFTFSRSPRSIMPRSSHSSKSGAITTAIRTDTQSVPPVIDFIRLLMLSYHGPRMGEPFENSANHQLKLSVAKASARVSRATRNARRAPFHRPKCELTRATPSPQTALDRLLSEQ